MPVSTDESQHLPVLVDETLNFLLEFDGGTVVDATLGLGGHSLAILKAMPHTSVIGLDQDKSAIALAANRFLDHQERFQLVHSNFSEVDQVLNEIGVSEVSAVIADLGVSSMQIDSETRGFSFRYDAPLDMRMDESADIETAAEILSDRTEKEIADLIYLYGEERFSRRIARRIVEERNAGRPLEGTRQLADLVKKCVPFSKKEAIHPATRTFQALRIAVNHELVNLESFLVNAFELLMINGAIVVITFHSLEDRIVKNAFQRFAGKCICPPKIPKCSCGAMKRAVILTKRPITASDLEVERNPRSRSAKLRALRKVSRQ